MHRTPNHSNGRASSFSRHVAGGLARVGAAAALLALLVALPAAVVSLVGLPQQGALADAFRTGRLDDTAIVHLGTLLFLVLWGWFAITALAEIAHIAAWRSRPRAAPLHPVSASPTGWVRHLVRIAMISSTAVVGSGVIAVAGTPMPSSAAAPPAASQWWQDADATAPAATVDTVRATGRDTPYSIAVRLGDPLLRDEIIELNRGTTAPSGTAWTSGVFPEGMSIVVPVGSIERHRQTWTTYTVVEGDSVYRIAARLVANDGGRVREVADEIIGRNLGRVMNDGALFDDPSLIRVGWQIEIPADSAITVVDEPIDPLLHTVVRGESYWSIAEDHLEATGQPADGPHIAELTGELIALNHLPLGHDLETLIVPGDVVQWPVIAVDVPAVTPPADEAAAPAPVVDVTPPPTTMPAPAVSFSTTPVSASPAPTTPPSTSLVSPTTAPTVGSVDAANVDAGGGTHRGAPVTVSLGAALLLCAGALGLVESRRRHQMRRAPIGARLVPPTDRDVTTERLLRNLPAVERAMRLDLALRSAGHYLAGTGAYIVAVTMDEPGTISLVLHRPERATPASPWRSDRVEPSRWTLDATVDTDELVEPARLAGQPCPALVHLGTLVADDQTQPGTALFIDLEAFGLLSVVAGDCAPPNAALDIVRGIATSLAASPIGETLHMVTHELEFESHLGNLNAEGAETIDAAIDCAAAVLGSTPTAIGGRRTFELRARGVGGEAWEPVVIVSGAESQDLGAVADLVAVSRGGGRGLAAVLIGPIEGAEVTLTAEADGWLLAPLGLRVVPVGLPIDQVLAVHDLLDAAERPLAVAELPAIDPGRAAFTEAPWQLVVRVLGQVEVIDRHGVPVAFDRGKALELAAWLSMHRDRPTRSGARTALWDLQVRDATFANVVSDARRAMARAVPPPAGEEWIERTLTEQLPLHPLVTSDADLLRARLEASRGLPAHEAIELLRPGVDWITDLPFAGTGYLWPDAEGVTSSLTLLATTAAVELARHCLTAGDVDGVFWATGRGLRVLSGHEELIGLRMRAYAQRGDLAGVRSEWEVYERAIHADPWSSGEPSPKLAAIRRELLSR